MSTQRSTTILSLDLETERRRQWLREMQTRPMHSGIRLRWWDFKYATKHLVGRTIHNLKALYYQRLKRSVVVEAHWYFDEHRNLRKEMRRQGGIAAMKAYFTDALSSKSRRSRTA